MATRTRCKARAVLWKVGLRRSSKKARDVIRVVWEGSRKGLEGIVEKRRRKETFYAKKV